MPEVLNVVFLSSIHYSRAHVYSVFSIVANLCQCGYRSSIRAKMWGVRRVPHFAKILLIQRRGSHNLYGWLPYAKESRCNSHILREIWR